MGQAAGTPSHFDCAPMPSLTAGITDASRCNVQATIALITGCDLVSAEWSPPVRRGADASRHLLALPERGHSARVAGFVSGGGHCARLAFSHVAQAAFNRQLKLVAAFLPLVARLGPEIQTKGVERIFRLGKTLEELSKGRRTRARGIHCDRPRARFSRFAAGPLRRRI